MADQVLGPRTVFILDKGLRFHRGECDGGFRRDFFDGDWRVVRVPHDYVLEGAYEEQPQAGVDPEWYCLHGSLPTEPAWYRLNLPAMPDLEGKSLYLECDGIFSNCRLWLNGRELGQHYSGYGGFFHEIASMIDPVGPNVLAIRVAPRYDGWWYEGGGIYRQVRLTVVPSCHFAWWGIHVAALPDEPEGGRLGHTRLRIRSELTGSPAGAVEPAGGGPLVLSHRVIDPEGKACARIELPVPEGVGAGGVMEQELVLEYPRLWSVDEPCMYRLESTLGTPEGMLDQVVTPFGVRHLRFDPDRGFFLNGQHLLLKGVNAHQDHAGVGVALPEGIIAWRLERLKEMGCNALRMSHNPVAPAMLDLCDRLGLLVIAENRHLGDTHADQTPPDTPARDHLDLSAMVQRDRNHPCIILWSLCNEQWIQGMPESAAMARAMKQCIRELDPDRLVTAALNGGFDTDQGLASVLDVIGINYHPDVYDQMHRRFPRVPLLGSEIASEVSTRGCYEGETWDQYRGNRSQGHLAAWSVNAGPGGQVLEDAWPALADRPFMAGGFVWSGFDYKGEPRPFKWPSVGSQYGIMDQCGFPKDNYHYYRAWWNDQPVLHLFPHWNWPGKEGQAIPVWVHSNCDTVELYLNGQSLGCQQVIPRRHLEWQVPYTRGELLARGMYKESLIETRVATTGPAVRLGLELQGPLYPDGAEGAEGIGLVQISVLDGEGRVHPHGDNQVSLRIEGNGVLLGMGNGDPSSHEPDVASQRRVFHGLAQGIIRLGPGQGEVYLEATAQGLIPARLLLVAGHAHNKAGVS